MIKLIFKLFFSLDKFLAIEKFTDTSFNCQNYKKIHSSVRRDAHGDGQNIQSQGQAQGNGWTLGPKAKMLDGPRQQGKQTGDSRNDYDPPMWSLW